MSIPNSLTIPSPPHFPPALSFSVPVSGPALQILEPIRILLEAFTVIPVTGDSISRLLLSLALLLHSHSSDLPGVFSHISQAQAVTYPPTLLLEKYIRPQPVKGVLSAQGLRVEPAIASSVFSDFSYLPSFYSAFVFHPRSLQIIKIKQILEDILPSEIRGV